MEVKVIRTAQELDDASEWFFKGDLSAIAGDTETMGPNWLRLQREMQGAPPERQKVLKDALKEYAKEALDHRKNLLATVQVANRDEQCVIAVMEKPEMRTGVATFLDMLKQMDPVWVFHNSKFDFHQLYHHLGVRFDGQKLHDTMLCESLLTGAKDDRSFSLGPVLATYPEIPEAYRKLEDFDPVRDWWAPTLSDEEIDYASRDVFGLIPLMEQQKRRMQADQQLRVRKLECSLTPRLIHVENTGVCIDRDKVSLFLTKAKEVMQDHREAYASVFGDIKHTQKQQILARIKEHYGVAPTKEEYDKHVGSYVLKESCDKFALLEAGLNEDPAIKAYLTLSELGKQVGEAQKWLDLPDNRLFVSFFQLATRGDKKDQDGGARSGRMSTTPQVQNWQNFMKQFCVAQDGWTVFSSDFAAIELRLVASIADEPVLREIFNRGESPHIHMFTRAFNTTEAEAKADKKAKGKKYRIAKEINFGFPYGMGGPKFCGRVLRGTNGEIRLTHDEGWKFRKDYFDLYNRIPHYHQRQYAFACLYGYVETRSGRRRYYNKADRPKVEREYMPFWDPFRGAWVGPWIGKVPIYYNGQVKKVVDCTIVDQEACWRAADWRWKNVSYNHPIQGGCADGMKDGVIRAIDAFDPEYQRLFALVHDSFDGVCREDKVEDTLRKLDRAMKDGMFPYLPDVEIVVEHTVGRTWASAPEDIFTADRGLWIRESFDEEEAFKLWMGREFQSEYELEEAYEPRRVA